MDMVSCYPYTWTLAISSGVSLTEIEGDGTENISNPLYKTPRLLKLFKIAKMLKMLKLLRVFKIQKFLMKVRNFINKIIIV